MTTQEKQETYKGDRVAALVRSPRVVRERAVAKATSAGYASTNDYLVALIAKDVGLPELAPEPCERAQEELPLTA